MISPAGTAVAPLQPVCASLDAPPQTHQEADDGADEEDDEQYLRNARRARRNSAESKQRRNQGDDEKYNCIMKHEAPYWYERTILTRRYSALGFLRSQSARASGYRRI